jgi:DNA-binding transcriptional ArsR family regulator
LHHTGITKRCEYVIFQSFWILCCDIILFANTKAPHVLQRSIIHLVLVGLSVAEIADELKVDQSTISRDIKILKALSQRFVFDLAKSDLVYYYKQCIDGIEEVIRKGWEIIKGHNNGNLTPKDKLFALKVIRECNDQLWGVRL